MITPYAGLGVFGRRWRSLGLDKDGIRTDREYTEIIHSMNKSDHSFRLITLRWKNPELDLFKKTEEYCYHGIITNYFEEEKDGRGVILRHNGRGNSENMERTQYGLG